MKAAGCRVICVAFSAAEQSVPAGLPRDILRGEIREATAALGVPEEDCLVLNFEVRRFPEFRQQVLDEMIRLGREFSPDLVFLPSTNDTHQDHLTIAQEGFRAFKRCTMLGYEVPWNNLDFRTSCFVSLDQAELDKKIFAIGKYKSQQGRMYSDPEFIRAMAMMRGVQMGGGFAEAFEVVRWVIK